MKEEYVGEDCLLNFVPVVAGSQLFWSGQITNILHGHSAPLSSLRLSEQRHWIVAQHFQIMVIMLRL